MAKEYDNTNSGIIFKNDDKQQPNHPDYKGSLNADGVDYWLSAWVKEGQSGKLKGKKFFSIALKPKDDSKSGGGNRQQADAPPAKPNDDIPF